MTYFESSMNSNTRCVPTNITRGLVTCVGGFLLACLPLGLLTPEISASGMQMSEGVLEGGLAAGLTPGGDLWGDDTIGALPIMGGGGGSFSGLGLSTLNMILLSSEPSLVLEGRIDDLKRMVAGALGDMGSFVYLEPTAVGRARLFFQGASTIELDRQLFETGAVKVNMYVGLNHTRNRVDLALSGNSMSTFAMLGGAITPMNLPSLVRRGVLDFDRLEVAVQSSPRFGTGRMSVFTSAHTVTLNQQQ